MPDPQDPATRDRSCLDWSEREREPHARMLAWYRQLLALRRDQPDLTDPDLADTKVAYDEDRRWLAFRRGDVRVAVNLGAGPADIPLGSREARVLAAWEPVDVPGRDGLLRLPGSRRWCCCRSEGAKGERGAARRRFYGAASLSRRSVTRSSMIGSQARRRRVRSRGRDAVAWWTSASARWMTQSQRASHRPRRQGRAP